MKNLFFIILLSSLYCVLNAVYNYDLINGDAKIFNLKSSQTYNFYIPMTQFQKANISLTFNNLNSLPFSNSTINEYSSRNSSYIQKTAADFSISTENNQLIATQDYIAHLYLVSYIALSIKPTSDIKNMSIKINIDGGAYEMSEGEYKTINNLISDFTYYLIIPAKSGQKMNLNLITNYNGKDTFDYITIYEFKDTTRQNALLTLGIYFNYDIKNNEKKISINHIVKYSETKMIGIRIDPKFNIKYIRALINFELYYYDLNNEYSKNISGIKAGNSYKLYIQTEGLQIANVSLSMKYNITNKSLCHINIYEKKVIYSSENIKSSTRQISSPSEIFFYQMANYNSLYLLLELIPNYNFKQLNIEISLLSAIFELNNEESKDFGGLLPGISYYLFIPSSQLQTINVGLKIYKMTSQPFTSIGIYEYPYKNCLYYNHYENKSISFTKYDNQLEAQISYINSYSFNYYSFYTVFEIKPIENIKYMSISLDIHGKVFQLYDSSSYILSNLDPLYKNYLSIYIEKKKPEVYIALKLNKIFGSKPFNNIAIYEYSKKEKNNKYIEEITLKVKDGVFEISFSYNVKISSTKRLLFEIIPNHYLEYINAYIEIKNNNNSSSNTTLIIVLVILITIIIIIGIFILLRIMKKNKNKKDNKQIEEPLNLLPA